MKILIDIRLLSRGGRSGVEEYTFQAVSNLISSLNQETELKLFYNARHPAPLPNLWSNMRSVDIINWRLPNKLLNAAWRLSAFPDLTKRLPADIVWSPHLGLISHQAPKIITIHDLSFLHFPHFFPRLSHLWHRLWQNVQSQTTAADHIITDSHFTKSDLVNTLNLPADKITVISPGLDKSFKILSAGADSGMLDFSSRYHLPHNFILFVGSLEPRKNIPAIISAFNLLKSDSQFDDLYLVLAGSKGWLDSDLNRLIQSSPHRRKIKIIRHLVPADRVFLYNKARVFIYPSFFEGFGFPPLEAQSCGVPVIASNRSSLPEVLNGSAILVDPWRIDELADSLKSVLTDENLNRHLITAGLSNIKRFSWSDFITRLMSLFSQFS